MSGPENYHNVAFSADRSGRTIKSLKNKTGVQRHCERTKEIIADKKLVREIMQRDSELTSDMVDT
jgi:hypothetical protein